MSIMLIEQNVHEALKIADRVLVMKTGTIILESCPAGNSAIMPA
jgi:branched-chain amino acid transport system ATP-binding protein